MLIILIFFISFFISFKINAQNFFSRLLEEDENRGKFSIKCENIDCKSFFEKTIEINEKHLKTKGYRIQVFFSTGKLAKKKAFEIKTDLLNKFPDYHTYIVYDEPYFKVRIGDFYYRADAYNLLLQVRKIYPGAYIVSDYIK